MAIQVDIVEEEAKKLFEKSPVVEKPRLRDYHDNTKLLSSLDREIDDLAEEYYGL